MHMTKQNWSQTSQNQTYSMPRCIMTNTRHISRSNKNSHQKATYSELIQIKRLSSKSVLFLFVSSEWVIFRPLKILQVRQENQQQLSLPNEKYRLGWKVSKAYSPHMDPHGDIPWYLLRRFITGSLSILTPRKLAIWSTRPLKKTSSTPVPLEGPMSTVLFSNDVTTSKQRCFKEVSTCDSSLTISRRKELCRKCHSSFVKNC